MGRTSPSKSATPSTARKADAPQTPDNGDEGNAEKAQQEGQGTQAAKEVKSLLGSIGGPLASSATGQAQGADDAADQSEETNNSIHIRRVQSFSKLRTLRSDFAQQTFRKMCGDLSYGGPGNPYLATVMLDGDKVVRDGQPITFTITGQIIPGRTVLCTGTAFDLNWTKSASTRPPNLTVATTTGVNKTSGKAWTRHESSVIDGDHVESFVNFENAGGHLGPGANEWRIELRFTEGVHQNFKLLSEAITRRLHELVKTIKDGPAEHNLTVFVRKTAVSIANVQEGEKTDVFDRVLPGYAHGLAQRGMVVNTAPSVGIAPFAMDTDPTPSATFESLRNLPSDGVVALTIAPRVVSRNLHGAKVVMTSWQWDLLAVDVLGKIDPMIIISPVKAFPKRDWSTFALEGEEEDGGNAKKARV